MIIVGKQTYKIVSSSSIYRDSFVLHFFISTFIWTVEGSGQCLSSLTGLAVWRWQSRISVSGLCQLPAGATSPLLSPLSPTKTNQLLLEPAGASGRPGGLQGTAGCRPETTLTLHCGTTDYNTPLASGYTVHTPFLGIVFMTFLVLSPMIIFHHYGLQLLDTFVLLYYHETKLVLKKWVGV